MNNCSIQKHVNIAPDGIASFAKSDICIDIHNSNADIAIFYAPFNIGGMDATCAPAKGEPMFSGFLTKECECNKY